MEAKAIMPVSPEKVATPELKGERVPLGSALYNRIVEFLYEEAALLDQIRLQEWGARLAPDLIYTAPLRETRPMDQLNSSSFCTFHEFHDDCSSRMGRCVLL